MPATVCSARIYDAVSIAGLRRVWHKLAGSGVILAALFVAHPSSAQKLYSYEPPMMDPYSTIYVDNGSCSAGKVLKVQGSPRNQRRKKSCVPMSDLHGVPRSGASR
ncbi:DUF6719 family protein [Bradyrhizobium sp. RDT10]